MSTTRKLPYEEKLGDRDPIEVMSKTPRELELLLEGLDAEQVERRPAPGKWNLREIVCHLADCELVWGWRLRYVYGEKGPAIQTFDQDSWAKIYKAYSLTDAIGTFASTRKWNLLFLSGLNPVDMQKSVTHPERGEETLWTVVKIAAGHDLNHLALVEKQLGR
jgi:hypothetical protein